MSFKAVVTFIIILLFCHPSEGQQQDGSVFERRITIHAENQPLSSILDQISWQAKVYFSYDASTIETADIQSISAVDKSLYSILYQLFNPEEYLLQELDNQIIISKNANKNNNLLIQTDSIPVKYFFLSGKIVDRKREDPIPYASVSVLNKPIG
ncbi:MAG: hypothetical protein ACOC10_06195, partial [Bacteroidota bacterium]